MTQPEVISARTRSLHTALAGVLACVSCLIPVLSRGEERDGMVQIPAGRYAPLYIQDEGLRTVKSFWLDVRPVTNAEFLAFVRDHPEWRRSRVKRLFADEAYLKHWAEDLDLGPHGSEVADSPVTHVSWFAARAYLKSQGKRLPTQDEWEYAACADENRADAARDPAFAERLLEWYSRPTPKILPSVRTAAPNTYGVAALHGYVWEWVLDFNNAMVTGESRADNGLDRDLYCAGGAAEATDKRNYAAFMRYAFRSSLKGSYAVPNLGFRGARDVPEPP